MRWVSSAGRMISASRPLSPSATGAAAGKGMADGSTIGGRHAAAHHHLHHLHHRHHRIALRHAGHPCGIPPGIPCGMPPASPAACMGTAGTAIAGIGVSSGFFLATATISHTLSVSLNSGWYSPMAFARDLEGAKKLANKPNTSSAN